MKEITDAMRDASEVVEAGVSKLEKENAALRAEIAKLKQPPVLDGKTPGEVAMAAYFAKADCGSRQKDWWAEAAAAVLAAFGQQPAPVAFTDADVERESKRLFEAFRVPANYPAVWPNLLPKTRDGFLAVARESLSRQPAEVKPELPETFDLDDVNALANALRNAYLNAPEGNKWRAETDAALDWFRARFAAPAPQQAVTPEAVAVLRKVAEFVYSDLNLDASYCVFCSRLGVEYGTLSKHIHAVADRATVQPAPAGPCECRKVPPAPCPVCERVREAMAQK